jgi:branched-chain amino acid transport system substrate-binding protein
VTAQVLRALAARPDAIMLGGTGTPGALPVIALSERGYKGPLYGNNGMISADFLRLAGKTANGIICPTGPVIAAEQLPPSNPIQKVALDFRAAFEKANGETPTDSFSSYSFDGWLVFADAAKRAMATGAKPGSPEFRAALRQALFTTQEVVGTQGVYTYTPADRHGVDDRSRILVRIEDGTYRLVP